MASDALTAVHAAVKGKPHVVVMDIGLPGGEGTKVIQNLDSLPQLADVPVVVLSGRDPAKNRAIALAAGAVLKKPVAAADVFGVVERALDGTRARA